MLLMLWYVQITDDISKFGHQTSMGGFKTGSGKKVKVSEESLNKAKALFNDDPQNENLEVCHEDSYYVITCLIGFVSNWTWKIHQTKWREHKESKVIFGGWSNLECSSGWSGMYSFFDLDMI